MHRSHILTLLESHGQRLLDAEKAKGRILYDSRKPRIMRLSASGRTSSGLTGFVSKGKIKTPISISLRDLGKLSVKMGVTSYLQAMRLKWCYPAFKEWLQTHPTEKNKDWFFQTIPILPTMSVIVENDVGDILLGIKSNRVTTSDARISIPAGVMEIGEDFKTAAVREVREGAGLNISLEPDSVAFIHPSAPTVVFTHIGVCSKGTPKNTDGEFDRLFFVPREIIRAYFERDRRPYLHFIKKQGLKSFELTETASIALRHFFKLKD